MAPFVAHVTASTRSACIFGLAHSPFAAFTNFFPNPVDPRKLTLRTAYPRFASHWCSRL